MAMYCLPLTVYVIGPAATDLPSIVCHSSLPLRASRATNCPSRPPANNTSEAVVRTPPSVDAAERRKSQALLPVFGSMARTAEYTSSPRDPPLGNGPANPWPSWNSGGAWSFQYVDELFSQVG